MMYKPRPSWTSSFVNNNDERAKVISSVMTLLARIRNQPISVAIVPEYGLSEHDLKSLEIGLVDDSASPDEAKREQYEVLHKYGARGRRSFRLDAFAVAGEPSSFNSDGPRTKKKKTNILQARPQQSISPPARPIQPPALRPACSNWQIG